MTILEALKHPKVKLVCKNNWLTYDVSLKAFKVYEKEPNINLLVITPNEHEAVGVLLGQEAT